MKEKKYFLVILSIIICCIFYLSGCGLSNYKNAPSGNLNSAGKIIVHYIDVGQGDSILIQTDNKNMLIDAGTGESKEKLISYLNKQNIKKLDYVVATHPHEDHIGGMSEVLKKYDIGKFYMPQKVYTTKVFENMVNELKRKNIKAIPAHAGIAFKLGAAECSMIAPNSNNYESINNYSAVLLIKYGDSKFLFMGDAEKLSEKEILSKGVDLKCDVLKVGHHGSTSSSSKEFLDKASPKIAVISCGKGNDYGHPHKETLNELNKRHIKVYRTDIDKDIVLISDGKTISKQ